MAPDLVKDAGSLPLLKAPVGGGGVANPRYVESVPLHPGAQHEEDRVHHLALWHPTLVGAERMLGWRRQQGLDLLPQPVRHPPAIVAVDQAHLQPPVSDQQIG